MQKYCNSKNSSSNKANIILLMTQIKNRFVCFVYLLYGDAESGYKSANQLK